MAIRCQTFFPTQEHATLSSLRIPARSDAGRITQRCWWEMDLSFVRNK